MQVAATKKDSIKQIGRSAFRFLFGTLLSRFSGLGRDIALAVTFGTNPALAAFLVAYRFALVLRRLLGEGTLQSAFIPLYESMRKESQSEGANLVRDLTSTLGLILLIVVGSCMGFLLLAAFSLDISSTTSRTLEMTAWMMPSLLFLCLYAHCASVLQCDGYFLTSSSAPLAFNSVWIVAALLLQHQEPDKAMLLLSLAVVLASACQWAVTIPHLMSIWKLGTAPIRLFSSSVKKLYHPLTLSVVGVAASQINSALDPLFATFADPEGPALLWYAVRIQQLPLALIGVSIAGALLPPLSRAAKEGNMEDYRNFFAYAVKQCTRLMVPCTALLWLLGGPTISFLFSYGKFGPESLTGTAACLSGYTFGLLPMALVLIQAPAFYARGDYRTPAIGSLLSIVANIILNAVFVFVLNEGAASIAWSTSICAWFNTAFLTWRNIHDGSLSGILLPSAKTLFLPTLAGTIVCLALQQWLKLPWEPTNFYETFLVRGLEVALPGAGFLLVCLLLGGIPLSMVTDRFARKES